MCTYLLTFCCLPPQRTAFNPHASICTHTLTNMHGINSLSRKNWQTTLSSRSEATNQTSSPWKSRTPWTEGGMQGLVSNDPPPLQLKWGPESHSSTWRWRAAWSTADFLLGRRNAHHHAIPFCFLNDVVDLVRRCFHELVQLLQFFLHTAKGPLPTCIHTTISLKTCMSTPCMFSCHMLASSWCV